MIEVVPAHESERAVRIELFGDEIEAIRVFDPLRGTRLETLEKVCIYPASHYVTPKEKIAKAVESIREEALQRLQEFREQGCCLRPSAWSNESPSTWR